MVLKHMAEEQKMLYLLVYHSSDSLVVALLVESRLLPSSFKQTMKLDMPVCQLYWMQKH